jgi:ATP-binding cassette, subfamily C, bacterial CydCD
MVLVGQYTKQKTDAAASALDRLSDHVVELARGLPVLVGLGRADDQAKALRGISDDYRTRTLATLRTAFLSSFVLELIATLSVAVVAVTIGVRILGGGMTLEVGLLVLILAPECYTPFREFGAAYHASRAGVAAFERVTAIVDAPLVVRPVLAAAVVGATDFSVRYPNGVVVAPVTFTLPVTGVTALLGASGSGKSTLLRALAGRLDADAAVSGELAGIDPDRVAWAPQHPRTVEPTARRELELYALGLPVDDLLARLGLVVVADSDPAELSPGELRRLAVARAALRVRSGATLLLLDEPTAHLDDHWAAVVQQLVAELAETCSVLVASHDTAVTSIATGTIRLGTPGALRERSEDGPVSEGRAREHRAPETVEPREIARAWSEFVRPALGRYFGSAALGTLAASFAIALTAVSAWLIVRASEQPAIMYLLVAIVGVRFFGLGRAALRYTERLVTHDAAFTSATALRLRLWAALSARAGSSRALQRGGTALDYLVGATDEIRDLVPRVLVPGVVGLVVSVGSVVTVALILPAAVAVIVATLAVALFMAPLIALAADRAAERDRQRMRSGVLRRFTGFLDAADDLRGNGVDGIVRAELAEADGRISRLGRRVAASRGLGLATVLLACGLGTVGMLAVGASAVASGVIGVELVAVLALLPIALADALAGFVAAVQLVPALVTALSRVARMREPAVDPHRTATLAEPVTDMRLTRLAATWPGATTAVFEHVSADAKRGDWLIVSGESGTGKSTLLSVLLGQLAPSDGWLEFNGRDIAELDPVQLRRHVSWCPQDSHLFDSTIRANLLIARSSGDAPSEPELIGALTRAGLGQLIASLPDGLDTRIGSQGSHLSGGERQRLAVARTLLSRSEIVLLDEPTAHLDEDTARQLMHDLRDAFDDRIVVLVTHHHGDKRYGDQVLQLGARKAPVAA